MDWWGWDGHGEEGLLRLRVSQQIVAVSVGDKCGGIHKAWALGYVEQEGGIESHPIGLHRSWGIVTHLGHVRWDGCGCWEALQECWADHEMGCRRGSHKRLSEQYWLVFECLTSTVDASGGGRFLCVVTWWCRCSWLSCCSMPCCHGSASHTHFGP